MARKRKTVLSLSKELNKQKKEIIRLLQIQERIISVLETMAEIVEKDITVSEVILPKRKRARK